MKKWLPALALVCAAAGIAFYLFFHSPRTKANAPEAQTSQFAGVKTALPPANAPVAPPSGAVLAPATSSPSPQGQTSAAAAIVSAPPAAADNTPEISGLPPVKVVENMRSTIREYGLRFGGNPVGINREITSALNGQNPKQVNFIRPEAGLRINDNGELIDPWGSPYFFHQLSAMQMEVRSAGPDKIMWTDDDMVAR